MRLLIIGHTSHYMRGDQIVGWGPTVREVNWLAKAFDSITHLACLHKGPAPESALPYEADCVHLVPLPPAGGLTWRERFSAIKIAPLYFYTIIKYLPKADVVQVRTPGPLGLCAMLVLSITKRKMRWTKFAGNWGATKANTLLVGFQRWWLRNGFTHGPVTVNGDWSFSHPHVYPFDNPSLSIDDLRQVYNFCAEKQLKEPIRLIFVGRLESDKGVSKCLDIVQLLRHQTEVSLDILGGGSMIGNLRAKCATLEIEKLVRFHGWVSIDQVKKYLLRAHFILLPSSANEGWPKVLSEAMAYGVVPIASDISAIPQILSETQTGFALPSNDIDQYVKAISDLVEEPSRWKAMVLAGLGSARKFSYEQYMIKLDEMFHSYYRNSPMNGTVLEELRRKLEISYAG